MNDVIGLQIHIGALARHAQAPPFAPQYDFAAAPG
jgi:hypothetical protein